MKEKNLKFLKAISHFSEASICDADVTQSKKTKQATTNSRSCKNKTIKKNLNILGTGNPSRSIWNSVEEMQHNDPLLMPETISNIRKEPQSAHIHHTNTANKKLARND